MSDTDTKKTSETGGQGRHLYDEHQHKPAFKFGELFKTTGKFTCAICEEPIVYKQAWYIANRVWYYIFFGFLIFTVLSQKAPTSEAMLMNFAMIIGALILYLIGAAVINRCGAYKIDEKMLAARAAKRAEQNAAASSADDLSKNEASESLTAEQAELQALYKYYEGLNAKANGTSLAETAAEEASTGLGNAEKAKAAETAPCQHLLVKTWKNYVPGMMEFTCAHCGTKLTFPADFKKRINMIFMVLSLVMIIPMMNFDKVSFLGFVGLTLLVLALATLLQIFLVKRCAMEALKQ